MSKLCSVKAVSKLGSQKPPALNALIMATAGGHVLTNKNLLTYRWRQATKSTHASQVQIGGLPRRAFAHYGSFGRRRVRWPTQTARKASTCWCSAEYRLRPIR